MCCSNPIDPHPRVICAGRSALHSFDPWYWDGAMYVRQCAIHGCSTVERSVNLQMVGEVSTECATADSRHTHEWGFWTTTADRDGTYFPPWKYKRVCRRCAATELAQDLVAINSS